VAIFAAHTLHLQRRSKRARFDATQHYWRVAMLCTLAACSLWLAPRLPTLAERSRVAWLCGVLALFGGFMSVMIGMLYKIVPFLVWLHLQNLGGGQFLAPNMNKVIAGEQIRPADAGALSRFGCCCWLPSSGREWFTYPAGLALLPMAGCSQPAGGGRFLPAASVRNCCHDCRYACCHSKAGDELSDPETAAHRCVVLSGSGFLVRGILDAAGLAVWLQQRLARGVAAHRRHRPAGQRGRHGSDQRPVSLRSAWLTAKLVGLLIYIGCGTMALKRGRSKAQRGNLLLVAALLRFAYIVSVR
jgi:hypothetical protein